MLWYFGFVSFHSRETGRTLDQIQDVTAELLKSQAELATVTGILNSMRASSDSLDAKRAVLNAQVAQLEATRDRLASSLTSASELLAEPAEGRIQRLVRTLFNGVPGNIVAALILAAAAWTIRKGWRRTRAGPPESESTA